MLVWKCGQRDDYETLEDHFRRQCAAGDHRVWLVKTPENPDAGGDWRVDHKTSR